jgi:hypothetical protein
VSNSAKNSADAAKKKMDDASKVINDAIVSNKQCIDTITDGANRAIPNFGGGLFDQFITTAKKKLAEEGCNQLSKAIAPATNFTMPTNTSTYTSQIPNIQIPPATQSQGATQTSGTSGSGSGDTSILQRIANLF